MYDDRTDFSDYPAERELDFSTEDHTTERPLCPICSEHEYKHKTARHRCELCGNYI